MKGLWILFYTRYTLDIVVRRPARAKIFAIEETMDIFLQDIYWIKVVGQATNNGEEIYIGYCWSGDQQRPKINVGGSTWRST
ncbi:MAG: hypothetical protein ABIN74_10740 [Ferruginibacter sp.]